MSLRLIRVSPRKTRATPTDALAWFGPPDRLAEADEVHVSVAFTYDKQWAEHLAEKWRRVAPVKTGGVAYGDRGEELVPGRYGQRPRDWATEAERVQYATAERCLAHAVGSGAALAYDRSDRLELRRLESPQRSKI